MKNPSMQKSSAPSKSHPRPSSTASLAAVRGGGVGAGGGNFGIMRSDGTLPLPDGTLPLPQ